MLGEQSTITATRGSCPCRQLIPPAASISDKTPAAASQSEMRGSAGRRIHASRNNAIEITTAMNSEIGEVKVIQDCRLPIANCRSERILHRNESGEIHNDPQRSQE